MIKHPLVKCECKTKDGRHIAATPDNIIFHNGKDCKWSKSWKRIKK